MISRVEERPERDEIEALLPWYATGRLEPEDVTRVETYLAGDPGMRKRLELVRKEQNETVYLNMSVNVEPHTSADQFMAMANGNGSARGGSTGLKAWLDRLFEMPFFGTAQLVGMAAVLVVLVQAVAIVMLAGSRDDGEYRQASGETQVISADSFVLVRFTDGASIGGIAKMLMDLNMTITDGPRAGGLFRIRIGAADMSASDRERQIEALSERKELIAFVTASK